MFRILPWNLGVKNGSGTAGGEKLENSEDKASVAVALHQTHNKMKRKRGSSQGCTSSKSARRKPEYMSHVEVPRGYTAGDTTLDSNPDITLAVQPNTPDLACNVNGATDEKRQRGQDMIDPAAQTPGIQHHDLEKALNGENGLVSATTLITLQQTIESEFNLEILLKHRELRMIDQELAKCQVALEQLRRCQVIPYPAFTGNFDDMQAVTGGIDVSHNARSEGLSAAQPAPFGVSDGPYTRHYARWLIPDAVFDGNTEESTLVTPAGKTVSSATTRNAKAESTTASKTRTQRGSGSARLHSLPAGYPEHKEEKGPMILKRSSDGKMVKLVCLDCRRENFNSAQGFINHCRIAHGRGFASHEAAAIASGEIVEFDEAGGVIPDINAATPATAGLVHPMIRSAHSTSIAATPAPSRRKKASMKTLSTNPTPPTPTTQTPTNPPRSTPTTNPSFEQFSQTPFIPSTSAPALSALFALRGHGGNLNDLITQTTATPPLDISSDSEDEDYPSPHSQPPTPQPNLLPTRLAPTSRHPRATMSPAPLDHSNRPASSKGPTTTIPHRNHISKPSTHLAPPPHDLLPSTPPTLSPTIANDPHPAPSLVSDSSSSSSSSEDEDVDYQHPPPASSSSAATSDRGDADEDGYVDIEVEDAAAGAGAVDVELRHARKGGVVAGGARRVRGEGEGRARRRRRRERVGGRKEKEGKGA